VLEIALERMPEPKIVKKEEIAAPGDDAVSGNVVGKVSDSGPSRTGSDGELPISPH
jgi:hypothetical protein